MIRDYTGRSAAVTGAASGLGRALARELALRGVRLALIDVDCSGLAKITEELSYLGALVTAHCVDIGSEQAVEDAAAEIGKAHGTVHLVVNNAAVSATSAFAETLPNDFERVMRVNFMGVVYGCRAFLPQLRVHEEGQILNVASCFAWLGCPGKTAYAASKAVRAFSESLRLELADVGVGVTLLYPGPLQTGIVRTGISGSEAQRAKEETFLQRHGLRVERVARQCLNRLLGNPARIVIGRDYRLMDLLARFSPALASRVMAIAATRVGF